MAEHSAVNRRVVGSSPTWGAKASCRLHEVFCDLFVTIIFFMKLLLFLQRICYTILNISRRRVMRVLIMYRFHFVSVLKEVRPMKSTHSISAIILILALLFVGSTALAENSGGGYTHPAFFAEGR